jgi:hypothetical protein
LKRDARAPAAVLDGAVDIERENRRKKRPGSSMHAIVHSADDRDRDGGALLMATCSAFIRSC